MFKPFVEKIRPRGSGAFAINGSNAEGAHSFRGGAIVTPDSNADKYGGAYGPLGMRLLEPSPEVGEYLEARKKSDKCTRCWIITLVILLVISLLTASYLFLAGESLDD